MSPSGTNGMMGAHRSVSELAGDRLAVGVQYVVVLASGQPGTVRLHAARRDQHRRHPRGQGVAHVHPRHFLHPNRRRRGQWVWGVRAVVDVGFTLPATQVAGVGSPALLCENGRAQHERDADGQEGLHGRLRSLVFDAPDRYGYEAFEYSMFRLNRQYAPDPATESSPETGSQLKTGQKAEFGAILCANSGCLQIPASGKLNPRR